MTKLSDLDACSKSGKQTDLWSARMNTHCTTVCHQSTYNSIHNLFTHPATALWHYMQYASHTCTLHSAHSTVVNCYHISNRDWITMQEIACLSAGGNIYRDCHVHCWQLFRNRQTVGTESQLTLLNGNVCAYWHAVSRTILKTSVQLSKHLKQGRMHFGFDFQHSIPINGICN